MPATPRLPSPGGDDGTWGDLLNQFLLVEHNADGSLANVARPADVAAISISEVTVKTANYTAVSGQAIPVDTTATAVTVTLPAATAGSLVQVRWEAGSHGLTIAASGVDKIGVGSATSVTDMMVGESRTWRAVPGGGRWETINGWRPAIADTIGGATDFDNTGAAPGMAVTVTQMTAGVPTKFGVAPAVPLLLINTVTDLPAGTPAGTIVVVKS